jgi:DNA-binding PadR family transcriptional regulator
MRFYILLALAAGEMNGYQIHAQVLHDSSSSLYFSFTSLNRLLTELEHRGLLASRQDEGSAYYSLTQRGLRTLKYESANLRYAARLAHERLPY